MKIKPVTSYFTNRDGVRFYTRRYIPSEVRSLLVICHGLGEHSGRYEHFTDYFGERGFAITTYDHRGHGLSDGKRGDIGSFRVWVDDLRTFVNESRRFVDGRVPVIVVGHSLGGLITLHYAASHGDEIQGAVISAPALNPTVEVPAWRRWLGERAARFLPLFTIGAEIDPQYLSRDASVVNEYSSDPLVFKRITLRAGKEILSSAASSMHLADRISCPILMIQGRGDRLCSSKSTEEFFAKIAYSNKKLMLYDGDFHEPFNDIVKDRVFNDIDQWIGNATRFFSKSPLNVTPYVIPDADVEPSYISHPQQIFEYTVRNSKNK